MFGYYSPISSHPTLSVSVIVAGMQFVLSCKEPLAGAIAGVIGTLLGFPLDTLKVTMQINHTTMNQAGKSIYANGGVTSFYRGIGSPLVALTILNTLNFSTYNLFSRLLIGELNLSDKFEYRVGVAAACVGPISSIISTPFELVKTQMQLNSKSASSTHVKFKNSLHATAYISQNLGRKALFKGRTSCTLWLHIQSIFTMIYN